MTTSDFMMPDHKDTINEFSNVSIFLHSLPALSGLAGGLFACYAAGINSITLIGTFVLTLIGATVGWTLFRLQRHQTTELTSNFQKQQHENVTTIHAYINELEKLFLKVNPILLRQVQSSRFHTEQEITTLSEQFAAMARQLEQIIASSADIKSDELADSMNTVIEETINIFDSIKQIVSEPAVINQSNNPLLTHINELDLMIQRLKTSEQQLNQLTAEVAQVSQNNSQVPIDAPETSKLAQMLSANVEKTSKTNHHIVAILKSAIDTLTKANSLSDSNALHAKTSLNTALMRLKSILSIYISNADMLRASSEQIHHEICAVLVALQFQDRVSQMLAQVENNLACLDETLQLTRNQGDKRHADMINIEQTLQQMKLDYSMPEQHANHIADTAVRDNSSQDDDLTFF